MYNGSNGAVNRNADVKETLAYSRMQLFYLPNVSSVYITLELDKTIFPWRRRGQIFTNCLSVSSPVEKLSIVSEGVDNWLNISEVVGCGSGESIPSRG